VTATKNFTAAATGAVAGSVLDAGVGKTNRQFSLKVTGTAADSVVALETSPDNTTYTERDRVTGPNWAYAAFHTSARYIRANVISLGTGTPPLAGVISCYPS